MFEKRGHPRVPVQLRATCRRVDGSTFAAQAVNLSVGGVFLNSTDLVRFGEELTIELEIPRGAAPLRLPAIVRWTLPEGFGVQFGLIGARDTHALVELTRG